MTQQDVDRLAGELKSARREMKRAARRDRPWYLKPVTIVAAGMLLGGAALGAYEVTKPGKPAGAAIKVCETTMNDKRTGAPLLKFEDVQTQPINQAGEAPGYRVSGIAIGQNGFGATIRAEFICATNEPYRTAEVSEP